MAHDLIIIISRADKLAKSGAEDATVIDLKNRAIAADQWLKDNPTPSDTGEEIHEWLESVQDELGLMECTVDDLLNGCPV